MIQEPPLNTRTQTVKGFSGLNVIAFEKDPRAALVFPRAEKVIPIAHLSHRDLACGLWDKFKSMKIVVVSYYCPHDRKNGIKEDIKDLEEIRKYAQERGYGLIMQGDSNAHSPQWGSPVHNDRGEQFESWINEKNLVTVNDGSHTWGNRKKISHIDVTILNQKTRKLFKKWSAGFHIGSTDHALITLEIENEKEKETWTVKKTDIPGFRKSLREIEWKAPKVWTPKILEREAKRLTRLIKDTWEKHSALRKLKGRQKDPWWDKECDDSNNEVLRLVKINWYSNREEDALALKKARKKHKKLVHSKKQEYYNERTTQATSPKELAKLTKWSNNNHKLGLLKKPNDDLCEYEEVRGILLDEHAPGSYEDKNPREKPTWKAKDEELNSHKLKFMSKELLKKALKEFGSKKRGGPDGLTSIMLKNLPDNTVDRLLRIIKCMITMKYIPQVWIESEIIFIPKPGKESYTEPRSFRPITLQSFTFKATEKMAMWKLRDTSFRHKPLHENQHAFRAGRSCDLALAQTVDFIESGLHRNQHVLGLFMDIKGAFDNLDQKAALMVMKERKMPTWFIEYYASYLRDRTAVCNINGSERRKFPKGSPQGGVFSPIFWNLAFDELCEILNEKGGFLKGRTLGVAFADDGNCLVQGPDWWTLGNIIQNKITKLEEWSRKFGVEFCPKKTVLVAFGTNKIEPNTLPEIKMGGKKLSYANQVKYLGVTLDEKLNFKAHIKNKVAETRAAMYTALNKVKVAVGPLPKCMKWVYEGVALPVLTYACHIWAWKVKESELRKVNRAGCKAMAPIMDNTPQMAMEVIYNIPPLDLVVEKMAIEKYLNIKHIFKSSWSGKSARGKTLGFARHCEDRVKEIGINVHPWDNIKEWCLRRTYEVVTRESEIRNEGIVIYTDGSKTDDGVGYGLHLGNGFYEQQGSLREEASVFQAEIMAMNKAAQWLINRGTNGQKITLYSDSKAGLMAMEKMEVTSHLVHETKLKWNHLGTCNEVSLRWVKAHVGIDGNEKADILAKDGVTSSREEVRITKAWVKRWLKEDLRKKWEKRWVETHDCRQTKLWFPSVFHKHCGGFNNIIRRRSLGKIVQFCTGFNNLNHHQHRTTAKTDKAVKDGCRACGDDEAEETGWHLATQCEALKWTAHQHLHVFTLENDPNKWTKKGLLAFINSPKVARLLATRVVATPPGDGAGVDPDNPDDPDPAP